jgi:peptide/nickel transport system permease protein
MTQDVNAPTGAVVQADLAADLPVLAPLKNAGFVRRFLHKPLGVISLIYLIAIAAVCYMASLIAPYGPLQQNLLEISAGPSAAHWFGTDQLGRDVLSRLLYGGQITLNGVAVTILTVLAFAVPTALIAGYLGGRVDRWVGAFVDLVLSIPSIIIVLAVAAIFTDNLYAILFSFGFLSSAGSFRVIRSAVITVREELYVAAAKAAGVSNIKIMIRHILPRVRGPIIVQATIWAGGALAVETGLTFLGIGVAAPAPSWGGSIYDASQAIYQDAFMLLPTGGIVALTILAALFLGDAVRDAGSEVWSGVEASPRTLRRRRRQLKKAAKRVGPVVAPKFANDVTVVDDGAVLSVSHLSVVFESGEESTKVVDDISFSLRDGEVLGIVGESGSGKSVTALSILGLLPRALRISDGHIVLDERVLTSFSERQLANVRGSDIAIVFQEPMSCLDPSFTVESQLVEVIRRHERMSRRSAKTRAIELLEQVRIPSAVDVAKRYPYQLSGGMAQRVCIALALAGRPKILIADEPTTALDVTVQAEILGLLRALQVETGMSVLLVTHDWGVIADLCDRAIVMYAGHIVEEASVEQLFLKPLHPYTRGLQLCNPALIGDGEVLPSIPGTVPAPHNWPTGCRFFDRCSFATPECADSALQLEPIEDDRLVRCIHWRDVALLSGQTSNK